jgi:hypothetical protein
MLPESPPLQYPDCAFKLPRAFKSRSSLSSYLVVARNGAQATFSQMFGLANNASHERTAACDWAVANPTKLSASNSLKDASRAASMGGHML